MSYLFLSTGAKCIITRQGREYVGLHNIAVPGIGCMECNGLLWKDYEIPASIYQCQDFCRNVPKMGWKQPQCPIFTENAITHLKCDLPYCGK